MYTLNIPRAIKKMTANEIKDVIYENYYKRIGFFKERSCHWMKSLNKKKILLSLANKFIEKVTDPRNAKERHEKFSRKKTENQ